MTNQMTPSPWGRQRIGSSPTVLILCLGLIFALTSVTTPAEASRPDSPADPTRVMAEAPMAPATPVVPSGASQLIWESGHGLLGSESAPRSREIRLGAGYSFDTSVFDADGSVPVDLRSDPPQGADRGVFIVQFDGPITMADHAFLESFGGRVYSYVPDYALLVSLTSDALATIADSPRVVWTGLYHPAYKISRQPLMAEPGAQDLLALVFPDQEFETVSREATAAGARVTQEHDNGINKILRFELDTGQIPMLARIEGIAWIEPYPHPVEYNSSCQWVVQTWVNGSRRIWDMGIRGQGQVLSTCDSGVRTTHQMFYDASVPINDFGDYPTHRKIIGYWPTTPFADIAFGDNASSGYHGTHTAGTVMGDDSPFGSSDRDGMAYQAKLYFLDAGGTGSGILVPADLNDVYIQPYNGNAGGAARICSNSWGTDNGGYYDTNCMTADQFMWLHPDFLLFFSNGNTGMANGVGSPASAKNCVSAGGTLNGTSANQLYASTSRGPTDDGRYKPTICAPASLYSAYGGSDTGYVQYHGTSMASPAMAGATGLIRQYLNDGWYPTGAAVPANAIDDPSAALMKAMAINSANPNVAGVDVPNNHIGWGRILDDDVLYFSGDTRRLALVDFTEGLLTGEYVEYQVYVASSAIPLKAALVWTDYPGNPGTGTQLRNDLNLVADDGTDTYLGNVYENGQSITGGSADELNVEECVRRDTPALGVWTFRIEAPNIPYGPQPFALVISGGLASDAGLIVLDKLNYGVEDMAIQVVDLNAGGSIQVTARSTTEPSTETVTLAGSNGVYTGTLPLRATYAVSENGELSISNGDEITITYDDVNPSATLEARAQVDLNGMTVTNVHASTVNAFDATVTWETSALANAKVYYGTTPALGDESNTSTMQATSHSIFLADLDPDQTYYYDVESSDNQNNMVRDDNGGLHYTFTTGRPRDVLVVIGDDTFTPVDRYETALANTGWSHTLWQGEQAATPFVGDVTTGMASFKAVIWQTGWEQYPMFSWTAMDSITHLMSLGSRLAVWSHDVAWDFCDPTSPDYDADRCTWMRNELHATWQEDPTTWATNYGYAGDPISGAYTGGVPYAPHRPGAAGDEINGYAGAGSYSYVWRDSDTTPDDIALRWTATNPSGIPGESYWAGTQNKVVSNFYEWSRVDASADDSSIRDDILDKTITWLIGRDNPVVDILVPNGGEVYTGSSISISWTESGGGANIIARELFYSDNGGESWTLITASPGTSPYSWNITSIPNGNDYKVRMLIEDDGSPALYSVDASADVFTIDRPGGDTRGPKVVAGSMMIDPNPILKNNPVTLTATLTDVTTGNANVVAAEWSHGASAAAPGWGTAMGGSFDSPTVDVTVVIDSQTLTPPTDVLWVRGQDANGAWGPASPLDVNVNADPAGVDDLELPVQFALHTNVPNPFNPKTTIRFDLPRKVHVELAIYDLGGRLVRTLVDRTVEAGRRSVVWDGRDEAGHAVGSGVYFYKLDAEEFEQTRRMTVIK